MNIRPVLALLGIALSAATIAQAAKIVVIYPRPSGTNEPIVYADSLDSTFVLGHVEPVNGELQINGQTVPVTRHGAFLAFLPIRRAPETKAWELTLTEGGKAVASVAVPYEFRSDAPGPVPDTTRRESFPRVIRVTDENAHTLTALGGSYHLFPPKGTPLLALGLHDGGYDFRLDACSAGFIEQRFAETLTDTVLDPVRIGDGVWRMSGDSVTGRFRVSRLAPWCSRLGSDARSLNVTIFDARLVVDRVRFSAGGFMSDAEWYQEGDQVRLTLRFSRPLRRGYEVAIADDSLTIVLRTPFRKSPHRLKGKRIVIDPGHGGSSDGAIGPLGTKEKDVTMRWAELLATELKRRGATVVLTRDRDVDVTLHERVAIATQNHADFLVSLHANALPDGMNPFVRHGTGAYFYQPLSRSAADVLHKRLLQASGLVDDGLYEANFAVVRPTGFPSVLLEAAYLIYPPEEERLRSDTYLRQLARGVARGLADYFKRQS